MSIYYFALYQLIGPNYYLPIRLFQSNISHLEPPLTLSTIGAGYIQEAVLLHFISTGLEFVCLLTLMQLRTKRIWQSACPGLQDNSTCICQRKSAVEPSQCEAAQS